MPVTLLEAEVGAVASQPEAASFAYLANLDVCRRTEGQAITFFVRSRLLPLPLHC